MKEFGADKNAYIEFSSLIFYVKNYHWIRRQLLFFEPFYVLRNSKICTSRCPSKSGHF